MGTCKECLHVAVCGRYAATGGHVRGCKHFAKGINVPGWIPVADRLPDKQHDWVLAAFKLIPEGFYGVPHIAELRNGKWWADSGDFPLIELGVEVTHWMPLPEPPKEVE